MTITVQVEAPSSISRDRLIEWLAELGIDAGCIRSVLIERGGISVETYATDAEGHRFAVGLADDMRSATHTVVIPITED